MAKNPVRDLTTGSPMRLVLGFLMPLLGGLLFQQLYNMVDAVVVGKFLGVDAFAGVGSTGSINFLVLGFCIGICNGFVIPVAQKFGERDERELRRYVANGFWLSAAFAVVITLLVCLFSWKILVWMKTPNDIIDYAYDYIFVIFLGIPMMILYNLLSGIIRSLGDSKTPIYFLLLSSLLNVVLDLVSITVFHMGVVGPAWATVISQGISGLLCLAMMGKRYEILRFSRDELRPSSFHIRRLTSIGVPMGLQYSITAIGSIVVQTAVNGLGSVYVAAVTAGNKVSQLFMCPFDAMGTTMAVYGGQNYGAMKLDRIHRGVKSCVLLAFAYSAVALLILSLLGNRIAVLFIDTKETLEMQLAIAEYAKKFLIYNSAFYVPLALVNILRFMIQGLGFTKQAVFAGVFEMIARCVIGFCLIGTVGYTAVCLANPAAWIMADLFLIPAYFYDINFLKKRFKVRAGR